MHGDASGDGATAGTEGSPAVPSRPDVSGAGRCPVTPSLIATDLLMDELAIYGPPDQTRQGHARRADGARGSPSRPAPTPAASSPPRSGTLGAEFRVEAESHQPEVLRQLVHLGLGWTVLPVLQAETEPQPLVRARPAPLLTRRLVVARRRSTPVDPVSAELIARLRAAVQPSADAPVPGGQATDRRPGRSVG